MINLIRSGSLYSGVPYAYAAVAPRGALLFTAGACPLDDRGEVVGPGDVRAQASLAVANQATALAEAAWDVVSAAFGEHDAPSTLLGLREPGASRYAAAFSLAINNCGKARATSLR